MSAGSIRVYRASQLAWHEAIHVVIPLVVGGMIYVAWRSRDLALFDWGNSVGLTSHIDTIRQTAGPWRALIPDGVLYSLPDGLWVYAFTAQLALIWKPSSMARGTAPWAWLLLPATLAIGGELGQLFGLVPGTFDTVDLIACAAAALCAVWLPSRAQKRGDA